MFLARTVFLALVAALVAGPAAAHGAVTATTVITDHCADGTRVAKKEYDPVKNTTIYTCLPPEAPKRDLPSKSLSINPLMRRPLGTVEVETYGWELLIACPGGHLRIRPRAATQTAWLNEYYCEMAKTGTQYNQSLGCVKGVIPPRKAEFLHSYRDDVYRFVYDVDAPVDEVPCTTKLDPDPKPKRAKKPAIVRTPPTKKATVAKRPQPAKASMRTKRARR